MTEIPPLNTVQHLTDAQVHGRDAARSVDTLARELESLAARLRQMSAPLSRGDGRAAQAAADVVSDYTQGTGAGGARLWSVVAYAADADRAYLTSTPKET